VATGTIKSTGPSGKYRTFLRGDTNKDAPKGTPSAPTSGPTGQYKTSPSGVITTPGGKIVGTVQTTKPTPAQDSGLNYTPAQNYTPARPPPPQYSTEINYTSAAGYSTKEGYTLLYERPKRASDNMSVGVPTFEQQRQRDISFASRQLAKQQSKEKDFFGTGGSFLTKTKETFTLLPEAAKTGFAFSARPVITQTGRFIEQDATKRYEQNIDNNRFSQRIRFEVASLGTSLRTEPGKQVLYAGAGYGVGRAAGFLGAKAVTGVASSVAARKGVEAGIRAGQQTQLFGGLALAGGGAASIAFAKPGDIGRSAVPIIAGGVGFSQGYRGVLPRPTVTQKSTSYGDFKMQQWDTGFRGYGVGERTFVVKQMGLTRTVKTQPATFLTSESTPVRGEVLARVRVVGNEPVPISSFGGRTTRPFQMDLLGAGRISQRSTLFSFADKNTVVVSRTQLGTFSGGREVAKSKTLSFGVNSGELTPSTLSKSTQVRDFLPYQRGFTRIGSFNRGDLTSFELRSRPQLFSSTIQSTTQKPISAVSPDYRLARSGVNLLSRAGRFPQTTSMGRRGSFTIGQQKTQLPPQQVRGLPSERIKGIVRFDATAVGSTPSFTGGSSLLVTPVFTMGRSASRTDRSRFFGIPQEGTTQRPIRQFTQPPITDTVRITDTFTPRKTETTFTPDTRTPPFRFVPPPPTQQLPPPAVGSPFPQIPLFGIGRGSGRERGGGFQSFSYAPSLTSVLFNIRGRGRRDKKKALTGFELRPL